MFDQQLIQEIASKRSVLLCTDEAQEGEATAYATRLYELLHNCGLSVSIVPPDDFKRAPPLLTRIPGETLAITASAAIAQLTAAAGMLTLGISPQETLAGAAAVMPDMRSLYALMGWVLFSKRVAPGEHVAIEKKVTTLIPVAGKGTRLGFDKPKILYPFDGVTALDIMYAKVVPFSKRIVLVASSEGAPLIHQQLQARGMRAEIIVDSNPYGTGGSVAAALGALKETETVLIIWGDQIGVPRETLQQIVFLHQRDKADLSLPTRLRKKPYIHLERNEQGIIEKVLRRRFNEAMPVYGENDLGVFVLRGELLISVLNEMKEKYWSQRKNAEARGEKAGEFDFLDIIPEIAARNCTILTSPFVFDDAALGFNTTEEAQAHVVRLRRGFYL